MKSEKAGNTSSIRSCCPVNEKQTPKRMDSAGSLTPDLEGAPRSASHPRRSPPNGPSKPAPERKKP